MIHSKPRNRETTLIVGAVIALMAWYTAVLGESVSVAEVGRFSAEKEDNQFPTNWEPFSFKDIQRHTTD